METLPSDIYTLSLHDALPISDVTAQAAGPRRRRGGRAWGRRPETVAGRWRRGRWRHGRRSEEHTSELQSRGHLVCRLLLEKKKRHYRSQKHHMSRKRTKVNVV